MRDENIPVKPVRSARDLPANPSVHKMYAAACEILSQPADGLTIEQAWQLASIARGVANKLSGWRFNRTT